MDVRGDFLVTRNASVRNFRTEAYVLATSASTLNLTLFTQSQIIFTGSTAGQIVKLPNSTILQVGHIFWIRNRATKSIQIIDNASSPIVQLFPYQTIFLTLQNGGWAYSIEPELLQDKVSTTDASSTSAQTISVPTNSVLVLETKILGVRTGGSSGNAGDSAYYQRVVRFKNVAGTVTRKDLQTSYTSEDQGGWNVSLNVSGTDVEVIVIGVTDNNIDWFVSTQPQLITF